MVGNHHTRDVGKSIDSTIAAIYSEYGVDSDFQVIVDPRCDGTATLDAADLGSTLS
jgi:hypothetical protein